MKNYLFVTLLLPFTATSCYAARPAAMPIVKVAVSLPNAPAVPVKISENGKALLPVIIASNASDKEKKLAQTLADYLQKISGAAFKVETATKVLSSATNGIAIGTSSQFSDLANQFDLDDPTKTEDYLLRSHAGGVLLVGASDLALEHAVWDFLYRLGYRQFFPGKDWEIIPHKTDIRVSINTFQHPDYYARRISPGYGVLTGNRADFSAWNARNRLGSGIALSTSHAYGRIILHHKAAFKEHPEYLTKPGGNKFCVSNPGLQQLVINDALAQFAKNPHKQSISMEPSDGGGWESDSCPDATIYKSITDRAVTLANLVAEAVAKKYQGKYVGMYAYNEHSPPPTINVDPHVIPSIATGFIHGGYTVDQLLDGWSQKAAQLGIREYYSVYPWDKDLPGRARAAKIHYLTTTIPHFYAQKVRFMTAESSDNWGPNGLGYYIASRLLWDTSEAANADSLITDFLDKSFGSAKVPMRHFYQLINGIDGKAVPPFSTDYIGRLYRTLDEAQKATTDENALSRIHDLALYVRYLELYLKMDRAGKKETQAAFNDVLRYTWRIRKTEMVHTLAVWRGLDRYVSNAKVPAGSGYGVAEAKDPLKSSEPFTTKDIQKIIAGGIADNPLRGFESKSYSGDLVKADALHLQIPPKREARTKFGYMRGTNDLLIWLDEPMTIKAKAGINYTNRGNTKLSLREYGQAMAENDNATAPVAPLPLQTFEVPPDKKWHQFILKAPRPGIYVLRSADKAMGSQLEWPRTTPVTVASSLQKQWALRARSALYFYVPQGTKTVGGLASGSYHIYGADGKVLLSSKNGYFNIPVPSGQDGKLWEFGFASGSVVLLTVPSYLARSPQELMLPKEVVTADTGK